MRITQISVKKLYGLHHYDIQFDIKECLKIIHAPNGYGKTTVLKLIQKVLEGQLEDIRRIPFESFSISFDEGELVVAVERQQESIIYKVCKEGIENQYAVDDLKELPPVLRQTLDEIQKVMPIYFIDANRLWSERRKEQTGESLMTPTVLEYGKELGEWMGEALAHSNYYGQELDRSFPIRLMARLQQKDTVDLSEAQIYEALQQLEGKRKKLEAVGLYSHSRPETIEKVEKMDTQMKTVLTLYIEDSLQKIKAFEALATKIHLLCHLINKRFSYKVMEVNREDGFVFRVPTNEVLNADKLSSGEQNELILMFQLLFKCPAQAMILMDEPEISLHIAWQQSFLEDMEAIAELSKIRIMIATHSPDIINGRWDLTTGLEEAVCNPI